MTSRLVTPIRFAFARGRRMFQRGEPAPPWPTADRLDKRLAAEWLGYELARVTAVAERENVMRVLGK